MNNIEYLNQISQSTRPTKPASSNSDLFKLIAKILGIAILAFVALLIIGSAIGSAKSKTTDLTRQIYLRSNNLNSILTTHNKQLKSSQLRSIGTSLAGVLTGGTNQIEVYLSSTGDSKKSNDAKALTPSESLLASETELLNTLDTDLTNARLNGILDRVYANQIQLQVSLLISLCSELIDRTNDENLASIINQFRANLEAVENSLNTYSNLGS